MTADVETLTIQPMLARSVAEPPEGDDWCYEPKWDGMRALLVVHDDGSAELVTRAGRDISSVFPELGERPPSLARRSAIIDGEIVARDPETGAGSFARLQRRIGVRGVRAAELGRLVPVSYVAFDVLMLDDASLMDVPLDRRREALAAVMPGPTDTAATSCRWQVVERLSGNGHEAYAAALEAGHEGLVAKRCGSTYQAGARDSAWCKVVRMPREEFVVAGWFPSADDTARPGAIAVASRSSIGAPLEFVGFVQRGIGVRERELLHTTLLTAFSEQPTVLGMPTHSMLHYTRPEVVVEIAHDGSSIDHELRSPRFLGLRPDRDPASVIRDPQWS